MSYLRAAGLSLAVSSMMLGTAVQAQDLTDQDSQISYSIGVNIGQGLMQQGLAQDVDVEIFMQGLQDSLEDNVQLSQEQIMAALQAKCSARRCHGDRLRVAIRSAGRR